MHLHHMCNSTEVQQMGKLQQLLNVYIGYPMDGLKEIYDNSLFIHFN